jgi:predicted CoA-substrate-specific enzyme activase
MRIGGSTGIDIGSRTTKVVWLAEETVVDAVIFDTGHDPLPRLRETLEGRSSQARIATGYGRRLAQAQLGCRVITEIRACARGAQYVCADADSVIDIGGQDSKAIELADGHFGRFEMNDRCAAGTGRFLEVMAHALGYTIENLGQEACRADQPARITSMCTVFAESEVVSLIGRGEDRRRIAFGLHVAAAQRVAAMASRIHAGQRCLLVGGVAFNPCMVRCLRNELSCEIIVPEKPEFVVALGAALVGQQDG